MLLLCDSSVMLLMVGKNLKISNNSDVSDVAKVLTVNNEKRRNYFQCNVLKRLANDDSLEHCLHSNYRVTIAERILLGGIRNFLVDHDDILGERDAST
jgi:hypothetical protein